MNFTRHLILLFVILLLASHQKPIIDKEMEVNNKNPKVLNSKLPLSPPQDLREFYDPDTVDLMQWIDQNSEPDDAFSGSMQLLAGVKLCTGRTLTNHPHFEDKALRDRTKELYQMYAKVSVAGQEVDQDMFLQSGQPIGRPHKPEEIQRILCDP